ncbi:protein GVQW3 [Trichonephila clavipes]|nr:protein GVQW3 [Trichonephila clavipes]
MLPYHDVNTMLQRHRVNTCNCILPEKCRINIRFLVKLKKSATKTFQILIEAYGDETLSSAYVFEWYKRFSGGRVSAEDDEPAGHPRSAITDQNIAKMRDMSGFQWRTQGKVP